MNADRLLPLLGRRHTAAAVEAVWEKLGTLRRPQPDPGDREEMRAWVLVRRQGIELGFIDEAYFKGTGSFRRRGKTLILNQIYFYTRRDEVSTFNGKLPFGLRWTDKRASVWRKLRKYEASRRSYRKDVWTLPRFDMTVSYKKADKGIDSVVCQLEPKPWPEKGRMQPHLKVSDWLELLGQPAASPRLRVRLRPLHLAKKLHRDDEEADFRRECGLELDFMRRRKARVLGAVRFFRSRWHEARPWTGELPFGLTFEDTQGIMRAKVGRKPNKQYDGDFQGNGLWRFPKYTLHVDYDNMQNRLLQISLQAPGF